MSNEAIRDSNADKSLSHVYHNTNEVKLHYHGGHERSRLTCIWRLAMSQQTPITTEAEIFKLNNSSISVKH